MSNTPIDVWAQGLLVGTNNGPWECGPDETAYSVWTKHRHTPIATDVDPGDAQLIAAAPELAQTVIDQAEKIERLDSYIDSLLDYVAPGVAENYARRILHPGDLGEATDE